MRIQRLLIGATAASLLFLNACKNKQSGDAAQQADSTAQVQTTIEAPVAGAGMSPELRQLLGEEAGLFRGVSLGEPITSVKEKEKIEQFETSPQHVGYTFEYPSLESADILYYHDKAGKVNKIDVDLYLNDKASLTRFRKELTDHFSQRYGTVTPNGSEMTWNAPSATVLMKDVTKGTNYGLKILFTPGSTALSASVK